MAPCFLPIAQIPSRVVTEMGTKYGLAPDCHAMPDNLAHLEPCWGWGFQLLWRESAQRRAPLLVELDSEQAFQFVWTCQRQARQHPYLDCHLRVRRIDDQIVLHLNSRFNQLT